MGNTIDTRQIMIMIAALVTAAAILLQMFPPKLDLDPHPITPKVFKEMMYDPVD